MKKVNLEKKKEHSLFSIFQSSQGKGSIRDEIGNDVVANFEKSGVIDLEFVEFDVWTSKQIVEWLKKISLNLLVNKITKLKILDKKDLEDSITSGELFESINESEKRRLILNKSLIKQFHYFNRFFPIYISKFEKRKGFEEIDLEQLIEKVMLSSNSELMEEFVLNSPFSDADDRKLVISLLLVNHSFDYDVTLSNFLKKFPESFKFDRKQSSILAIGIEKTIFEWNEYELITPKTYLDNQVLCIAKGEFNQFGLSDILDGINEWNQMKFWNLQTNNSSHFVQDIMKRVRNLKMHFLEDSYFNFIERVQERGLILL